MAPASPDRAVEVSSSRSQLVGLEDLLRSLRVDPPSLLDTVGFVHDLLWYISGLNPPRLAD